MFGAAQAPGCFLCRNGEPGREREGFVLERGRSCYALLNLYPYNNGHLMVAPYAHLGELLELPDQDLQEMVLMARGWIEDLRRAMSPAGFNMGWNLGQAGGAGVPDHLHLHLVPRWRGDTNFMTALGHARVLNQSLEETWEALLRVRARRRPEAGP